MGTLHFATGSIEQRTRKSATLLPGGKIIEHGTRHFATVSTFSMRSSVTYLAKEPRHATVRERGMHVLCWSGSGLSLSGCSSGDNICPGCCDFCL